MISLLLAILCLATPDFSLARSSESVAYDGGQDQGGGNMSEMEFRRRGLELVAALQNSGLSDAELGFTLNELSAAVDSVDVNGVYCRKRGKDGQPRKISVHCDGTGMTLKGREKDAINSLKQKKIWFDLDRWDEADLDAHRLLALREYLRYTHTPSGDPLGDALYDVSVRTYLKLVARGYFSVGGAANMESLARDADYSQASSDPVLRQLIAENLVQAARCTDYVVYMNAFKGTSIAEKNRALLAACVVTSNLLVSQLKARQRELGLN